MALILTFLGKGGTGRTTIAIATARSFASQGKRVLLAIQDSGPAPGLLLGTPVNEEPQMIVPNLQAVQFQTTLLLERKWQALKQLEIQYSRSPFFREVFGQELSVLPGMDGILALNAIREYDVGGQYDVIVYDGPAGCELLRLLGLPEVLSWYVRRFQQLWLQSDLGKVVTPLLQPIINSTLTVAWGNDPLSEPADRANAQLDKGKSVMSDPNRVAAYLVATADPSTIATAKYLWGGAQQVGITVAGLLLNQTTASDAIATEFAPLPLYSLPTRTSEDWQPLIEALPHANQSTQMPKPITIDVLNRQIRLFLPGFNKKQVKLTQYGPEITIDAGDQRRNILLPPQLSGSSVTGAKFQNNYLTISL